MDVATYRKMLDQAKADYLGSQKELGEYLQKQESVEKRLVGLKETIVALCRMLGEEFVEEDALGFTDAVRQAFKSSSEPLAPTDVRGRLQQLGFDLSKYGNVLASIHTIISRLSQKKEIKHVVLPGNKPGYQWIGPTQLKDLLEQNKK